MPRALLFAISLGIFAGLANSQIERGRPEKPFQYNGNGHVYFSGGACQHGYTHVGAGAGGEGFLWRGLTMGADLGVHRFVEDQNSFGLFSFLLGYHFVNRKVFKRVDPFVNGSLAGLYFGAGYGAAGSLGGGLNYWFRERVGLRTEVRFQILAYDEALAVFRIGLSFR